MTHTQHIRRRSAALALAVLGAILCLAPSTASAASNKGWYGWGVSVELKGGAPDVDFVAYVAEDGTTPRIVASQTTDISSTCVKRGSGTITYSSAGATFDGRSYLQCELPSWYDATSELGFNLPGNGEPMVCSAGGGPLWGDFEASLDPTATGTMPVLSAPTSGIRVMAESTGATARARLDLAQTIGGPWTSYRSPSWTVTPSPARALIGQEGDGLVMVADSFGWLDYFANLSWRSFFTTAVEGAKMGTWVESTAPTAHTTINASRYELGVDGGPLYIGYDPHTAGKLDGTLGGGHKEPGCKGL